MIRKCVFLVGITMCLTHVLYAESLDSPDVEPRDDIEDIIYEAWGQVQATIEDAVNDTNYIIQDGERSIEMTVETINNGTQSAFETAENETQGLGDNIMANVEELISTAESQGLDGSSCADGIATRAQEIEYNATDMFQTCFNRIHLIADDIIIGFEAKSMVAVDSLNELQFDVLDCISGNSTVFMEATNTTALCLFDAMDRIKSTIQETVNTITDHVTLSDSRVEDAIDFGVSCSNSTVEYALSQQNIIIEEVENCIENLS